MAVLMWLLAAAVIVAAVVLVLGVIALACTVLVKDWRP